MVSVSSSTALEARLVFLRRQGGGHLQFLSRMRKEEEPFRPGVLVHPGQHNIRHLCLLKIKIFRKKSNQINELT